MQHRLLTLLCFAILFGCNRAEKVNPPVIDTPDKQAKTSVKTILLPIKEAKPVKEFSAFWDYYSRLIKLNEDFLAYDKKHQQISKEKFLQVLATGKYQPILINPTDSIRYQLKPSPPGAEESIADYMSMYVKAQLAFYHMEGKPIPHFNFKTLEGNNYTSENTKGKIVLFKCWFISCAACVAEMPELNDLVARYKDRKDIIFISLAIDKEAPLRSFLKKTKFDYQTVAGQEKYMSEKLKIILYPTHYLIDKSGKLVKVTNTAEELEIFLERMLKE